MYNDVHIGWNKRYTYVMYPDSKVHGANMGPIWGRQDPGGLHVGPMNLAIWVDINHMELYVEYKYSHVLVEKGLL